MSTPLLPDSSHDDMTVVSTSPTAARRADPASPTAAPGAAPGETADQAEDSDADATVVRPSTLAPAGLPTAAAASIASAAIAAGVQTAGPPPRTQGRTGPPTFVGETDNPEELHEHQQVGRYLIKERLGRGGMAAIFRAHDPSIGRDVAIKFLHASLCEDEEYRTRFLREARAAGALSHHNIVVVHDVGELQRRPYMAMELIQGVTLSDLLKDGRQIPIRDVVVIGLQLARALEYAHAKGVVHRDIKPGNIMLLGDGKTIKVADFGIAYMDDSRGEQRTEAGTVMGTPQYMSPEQTRGDKVDGRSDLFSAGIVMYQMLAGERPFRGDSMVAIAHKIANEAAPALRDKRPEVRPSLRRVVERCLAKQPGQRYQSGEELAQALSKVLKEIDASAAKGNKPRMVSLRVRWAALMALIVAGVMGLTATVVTQRQYAAMMGQASEYGESLARFIAAQNAAAVLGEEWDAVDVAVQAMLNSRNFERLLVIDGNGVVRVSSRPDQIGKPYQAASTEVVKTDQAGATAVRYESNGESVLGFEAPVLFQGKAAGRVALGIPEEPITRVARLSISLLGMLALVTVVAVAIAMYVLTSKFAKPIRLVAESMAEIGKGRFDHRINEPRNDEFGELFRAFDGMAQSLQGQSVAAEKPSSGAGAAQATSAS